MTLTNDQVIALAEADAAQAIEIARSSTEPVEFITNNAYMPPLRGFGQAETVWASDSNDGGDLFTLYDEVFEKALEAANVYIGCPDYDNALYVVDMNRWEHIDDPDESETLSGEWRERSREMAVTYTWVVTVLPGQSPQEAVEEYVHSVGFAFDSPDKIEPIDDSTT